MRKLNYLQGAIILALTNLVTASLAFYFRIYFTRHVGAEGMGVFQLVFPLYVLLITLASGGITTALSKIIAEYHATKQLAVLEKTLKVTFLLICLWSMLLCILVFFNAEQIANLLLKDSRTVLSLIVLVPAIFFISVSAVFRGYFFGIHAFKYPAMIDIVEKIVRLAGLILLTDHMLVYGIAYACAGAMLATTAGEMISTLLLYLVYILKKSHPAYRKTPVSSMCILRNILGLALPLSFGGALLTIEDMISAVLVPAKLKLAGYDPATALSLYGEITGMVMPLVHYPGIFVFALTTTLIPAITQSHINRNQAALLKKCQDSLTIAWSLGLLATVLCISYPEELCRILFHRQEAGNLLFWTGAACAFHYFQFIQVAILNSIGFQRSVLTNTVLHILVNVACIVLLVPVPQVGIYGLIVGYFLSGILLMIRNILLINKLTDLRIRYSRILWKPLLPFLLMFLTVRLMNSALLSIGVTYNMIFSGVIGMIAFCVSLLWCGVFTTEQVKKTILFRE